MILEPDDKVKNGDIIYYDIESAYVVDTTAYVGKTPERIQLDLSCIKIVAIARNPTTNELALIQYWRPT
jgi:hypothetical protein